MHSKQEKKHMYFFTSCQRNEKQSLLLLIQEKNITLLHTETAYFC